MKAILLSVTRVSDRSCMVNCFLRAHMVTFEEVMDTGTTSNHFE